MATFHSGQSTEWPPLSSDDMNAQSKSSLEAAAEAAAKVNAMLIAKGKLKPSQLSGTPQVSKPRAAAAAAAQPFSSKPVAAASQSNLIVAEVEINDVPIGCRNLLTRGATQEEISKMSGAAVSTRGRFMSPEDKSKSLGERPLYLCVQGPDQHSVDLAVKRINEIIGSHQMRQNKYKGNRFLRNMEGFGVSSRIEEGPPVQGPPPPLPPQTQVPPHLMFQTPPPLMSLETQPPGLTLVSEKLYIVGSENAPPSFDVKGKVLGPGGSYIQHIANESGSKVTLRGKGSGVPEPTTGRESLEPLHLHIQHPSVVGLQQAKELAQNLIQTVQQEIQQLQALASLPPGTAAMLAAVQLQTSAPPPRPLLNQQTTLVTGVTGAPSLVTLQQPQFCSTALTSNPLGQTLSSVAQQPSMQYTQSQVGLQPITSMALAQVSQQSLTSPMQPGNTVQVQLPPGVQLQGQSLGPPGMQTVGQQPISLPQPVVSINHPLSSQTITHFTQPGVQVSLPGVQPPHQVQALLQQPGIVRLTSQPGQMTTTHHPPLVQPESGVQLEQAEILAQETTQPIQLTSQGDPIFSGPPPPLPFTSGPPPSISTSAGGTIMMPPSSLAPPASMAQIFHQSVPLQASVPPPSQVISMNYAFTTPSSNYSLTTPSSNSVTTPAPATTVVTMATPTVPLSAYDYYSKLSKEESQQRRRFTEEKQEEKLPENLLGYQHGPPHIANLVQSSPPPPPPSTNSNTQPPQGQMGEMPPPPPPPEGQEDERFDDRSGPSNGMMMPPPPPPGPPGNETDSDKKLMPPPPLNLAAAGTKRPSGLEREAKRTKGALGSVAAYGSDEEEDEANSAIRKQQREAAKYSFNQYSSKAQIYNANTPPPELQNHPAFMNQGNPPFSGPMEPPPGDPMMHFSQPPPLPPHSGSHFPSSAPASQIETPPYTSVHQFSHPPTQSQHCPPPPPLPQFGINQQFTQPPPFHAPPPGQPYWSRP